MAKYMYLTSRHTEVTQYYPEFPDMFRNYAHVQTVDTILFPLMFQTSLGSRLSRFLTSKYLSSLKPALQCQKVSSVQTVHVSLTALCKVTSNEIYQLQKISVVTRLYISNSINFLGKMCKTQIASFKKKMWHWHHFK